MPLPRPALLAAALLCAAPAAAQTSDLIRQLSNALSNAATASRERKIKGPLTAPLIYTPAAGPIDPSNPHDPRNLDIAGVRLGMNVSEARAALRAAGFVDENINSVETSYAANVVLKWHELYGINTALEERAINGIVWHKGEERVLVTFLVLPDGPIVNQVHYKAGEQNPLSVEGFTRGVLAKYGAPSKSEPNEMRWCTVKAPECEDRGSNDYPLLTVYPGARFIYLLGDDAGRKEALEKRFEADVQSRKPADQAPSF